MYKILICDDERDIRNALRIYLTGEGYAVCEADSGLAALELMQREEVQLVLMDIMMPGMDGMTATAKLREQSNVPVVVDAGLGAPSHAAAAMELGADAVLVGRPLCIAAIGGGVEGVTRYWQQMQGQLVQAMLLTGCASLADVREHIIYRG